MEVPVPNIDAIHVLLKHGNYLLASLDFIKKNYIEVKNGLLDKKEILDLVKAVKDGKTPDQTKFPQLPSEAVKKYGMELRKPFVILNHYKDFQEKTQKLFVDIFNECRTFELSWNYVFTIDILRLFTVYVKLAVFLVQLKDVDRIPIVYDYCVKMSLNDTNRQQSLLIPFIKERTTYFKITSELRFLSTNLFGIFKSNISDMYRFLTAGISFDWSSLNVSDNPEELDQNSNEFPFYKPEYVVMIHLNELCECFVCYIITNYGVLGSDPQFLDVLLLIMAHTPNLIIHGDSSYDIFKILQEVKKFKDKKSDSDIQLTSDKKEEMRKSLVSTRQYRCRKLTMIIEEFLNSYHVDPNILCSKNVILHAILGFAHHTAISSLENYHSDNDKLDPKDKIIDVIPLIYRMTELINLTIANIDSIQRFFVFNFREYDCPYLQHTISSFNIPAVEYNRLVLISQALGSVDVEQYDNGTRYDLTGLRITFRRLMASFNKFSTTHGVLHLSPLFNLISAIYYRVNTYCQGAQFFIDIAPIHTYWRYVRIFMEIGQANDTDKASAFPSILGLIHFYYLDRPTVLEFPNFAENMKKHTDEVLDIISNSILKWAKSLQNYGLQSLLTQVSPARLLANANQGGKDDKKYNKKVALVDMAPGDESQLKYRNKLTPIFLKLSLISDTFNVFREMGTINVFGNKIDVFNDMSHRISNIMINLFDDQSVMSPFELTAKLQNTKFIIAYIMTAANINAGPIIFDLLKKLTYSPIEEKDNLTVIKTDDLGNLAKLYIQYFSKFFKSQLDKSSYSTTSQSFFSSSENKGNTADVIQLYASKSAIRTLNSILGISGIACIDIQAADSIVSIYKSLASEIKKNITQQGVSFKTDPFNLPNAQAILSMFCHIGAISKYRQLLRYTVSQDEAQGQFAFLSKNTKPETDTILLSRLKDQEILKVFKAEWFPSLMKSLFCTPHLASVNYSPAQDSFDNNLHLLGFAFDNVIGALHVEDSSFDISEFYSKILENIFRGIGLGQENIKKKQVTKWNTDIYLISLDHLVKTSIYLNYSLLETLIPYQILRGIYTRILSKGDAPKADKPAKPPASPKKGKKK